MAREVRIGCVQSRPLATFDEAIAEARRIASDAVAAGAELVCLPEYCGGLKSEGGLLIPPAAPEAKHPVLDALRAFASESRVWMLIGSIAIDGPRRPPRQPWLHRRRPGRHPGPLRQDLPVRRGPLAHLQQYRESAVVAPGEHAVVADTPWGRLGMTICYDLRFPPALSRPRAGRRRDPHGARRLHQGDGRGALARSEPCPGAIENGAVVVAPCARGRGAGRRCRLWSLARRLAVGRGARGRWRRCGVRRHHGGRRERRDRPRPDPEASGTTGRSATPASPIGGTAPPRDRTAADGAVGFTVRRTTTE